MRRNSSITRCCSLGIDSVEGHHRLAHAFGALGAQLIEQPIGRGPIEAGHEDGRFADARFVQLWVAAIMFSAHLSDPIAQHVGGGVRVVFDQLRKLVVRLAGAGVGGSARACGGGTAAVVAGQWSAAVGAAARLRPARRGRAAERTIDRNTSRPTNAKPIMPNVCHDCRSQLSTS